MHRLQRLQHLGLAQACVNRRMREQLQQLGLGVQREQLAEFHGMLRIQPTPLQQGLRSIGGAGNLVVHQLARTKPGAAPHQHAHHQRLRGLGQLRELCEKPPLRPVQQIAVALADPGQCPLKVVQVVIAVGREHRPGQSKKPEN